MNKKYLTIGKLCVPCTMKLTILILAMLLTTTAFAQYPTSNGARSEVIARSIRFARMYPSPPTPPEIFEFKVVSYDTLRKCWAIKHTKQIEKGI